jgi:hypothetical protein
MLASDPAQAADSAAIDLAKPAGLADAPLGDGLEDRLDLRRREPRVEQGRALALGETGLQAEHAPLLKSSVSAGYGQISGPSLAMVGAVPWCGSAGAILRAGWRLRDPLWIHQRCWGVQ